MAVIGSLSVKLGLVTQDFQRQMDGAKTQVNTLKSSFDSLNRTLGMFGVSLGAASIANYANQVFHFADEVQDLGAAFDLSVSKVLQFRDALGQSGGKAENAEKILGTLFDKIQAARDGMVTDQVAQQFQKLGLSISDLKQLQPEQALEAVFRGLSKINSTYERTALIKDLLGKGGLGLDVKNLATLMGESSSKFDASAEAINKVADAADRLARAKENLKIFAAEMMESSAKIYNTFLGRLLIQQTVPGQVLVKIFEEQKKSPQFSPQGTMGMMTMPGAGFGNINPMQIGSMGGITPVDLSAFQSKLKTPQISLGVAAKDIKKEVSELEQVIVSARYAQSTLNVDQLLSIKSQTSLLTDQLALEKERIQLKSDAYALSKDDQKLAEIELNRKEQIVALDRKIKDLEWSTENQSIKAAQLEQLNAQKDLINQIAEAEKNAAQLESERQASFKFGWEQAFKQYAERATDAAQVGADMFNTLTNDMTNSILEFARTGKFAFSDFARSIIADLLRIAIRAQMTQILSGVFSAFNLSRGVSAINNAGYSPVAGVHMAAAGGFIDGPTIVGENGPELFIPSRSGAVVPHARMGDAMGGQPQTVINGPYIANMSAIDTQSATQFLARNRNAVFAANQSAQRSMPVSR